MKKGSASSICVTEQEDGAASWADASELDTQITTENDTIEVLGNITRSGSGVTVSDIAMYGSKGDLIRKVGPGALRSAGAQLLRDAESSGVRQVTFSGVRVAGSSGLAGHDAVMTVFFDEIGAIVWRLGP
jgi:hypothetical protein